MRAIQYSRDSEVKSRGHGVLDRPDKPGDDERRKSCKTIQTIAAAGWIASLALAMMGCQRVGCLKIEHRERRQRCSC
jgi:hypothetical protein